MTELDVDSFVDGEGSGSSAGRRLLDGSGLLAHLDVAVVAISADGVIIAMSESIEPITGLPAGGYLGATLHLLLHPDDVAATLGGFRELVEGAEGSRSRFAVRTTTADGTWRWVDAVATRCLDRPGIEAIVATVRDAEAEQLVAQRHQEIEESRRRQIDDLEKHEAFLQSVLSVSAHAVIITDADLHVRWVSPSTESFSGWTVDQLGTQATIDLLHPDDVEAALEELDALLGHSDRRAQIVECRIRMADGGYKWMRITGEDMRDVPGVRGVVLCFTDIDDATTARLALGATERRFEALVRNSHDCIAVTDAEGRCLYASPAITRMLGWEAEQMYQAPFGTNVPEPDSALVRSAFERAIADPSRPQLIQMRVPHRDGSLRWAEVVFWSRLEDPDVRGVVANFRDVTEQRRLVAELEERNEVLRSLAFSSTTGLFEEDSLSGVTFVNERFEELVGLPAEQCLGRGWRRVLESPDLLVTPPLGSAPPGQEERTRFRIRRPDGETRWVDIRSTVLPATDGVTRRFGGIEDVTAMVEAEESLRRLAEVFDITDDLVLLLEPSGAPIYMNQAARDLLGGDLTELLAAPGIAGVEASIRARFRDPDVCLWSGEVQFPGPDGTVVPTSMKAMAHRGPDGAIQYVSVVARDISERMELESILEREATHDPLTGLPNRSLLLQRIHQAVERAGRHVRSAALLFIDLDHFKVINDSLGHSLGDLLLRAIAARILVVIRPGDTVARFGGDEFVVLCEDVDEAEDALSVAHRVETALQAPFEVDGHEIHVGVSMGIAFSDPREPDPGAILRDADTAMYEAKSRGRGRWVVFDDELRTRAVQRQLTEAQLRQCRSGENLRVFYQPVMDLRSGTIRGVEALLRWERHGELVGPDQFVSVAEETGLIVPIGTWALEQACEQGARWQREQPGWADLGVSVNVSARQLQRPGFLSTVSQLISSSGLGDGTLTVEITESVLLDDAGAAVELLGSLRDMGVHVAVDDFGTGYSSLTYLHSLPVDAVKLDRSFVAGVSDDIQKRAIVTAVLNLAKALGLQSVAEGIETERQLAELRLLGCVAGQGFLISPAVEADEVTEMLRGGFAV